jgi:YD repeat-containing protein
MSSATDESGRTTAFTYNPAGQISSITAPARAANGGVAETTSYSYDGSGHLKTISLPVSGATIGFVYDGFGRVQSTTATGGEVTSYTYDAADRLTTIGY